MCKSVHCVNLDLRWRSRTITTRVVDVSNVVRLFFAALIVLVILIVLAVTRQFRLPKLRLFSFSAIGTVAFAS